MERKQSNKLLIGSILVLIFLNLATLSGLWYVIYFRQPFMPGRMPRMPFEERLYQDLNFDAEQRKAADLLHKTHFQNADSLEARLFELRSQMIAELFKDAPDTNALYTYAEGMGSVQASFERKVSQHFLHLKAICKPEQYPQLKSTLMEMIDHSRRPMPPFTMRGGGPMGKGRDGKYFPSRGSR